MVIIENSVFQGIVDMVYWFFTGAFGFIQEGAGIVADNSGIPPWFLILIVLGFMVYMIKVKMNTLLFWGLLFGVLIVVTGLVGVLPIEQVLMTQPTIPGGVP